MAKIQVTCPKCKHKFWMEDYECTACPNCGFVVKGPKYKSPSGPCFITTACVESVGLPDDCLELKSLRWLRDNYLSKTKEGQDIIEEYYQIAPEIVEEIEKEENSSDIYFQIYKDIKEIVLLIKNKNFEKAIKHYQAMVFKLKQKHYAISKEK